ncbi:MAG: hypothetical protein ACI8QZ_004168 [Chlamydiales bacterium]|jgi:hypothetical protein
MHHFQIPLVCLVQFLILPTTIGQEFAPGGPAIPVAPTVGAPLPAGSGQEMYVCTSSGSIYRVDHYDSAPTAVLIGDSGLGPLYDMAFDPLTGEFVVLELSGSGTLVYRLDPVTLQRVLVGLSGCQYNALEITSTGFWFARTGSDTILYGVNPQTGLTHAIGDSGFRSTGDLAQLADGSLLGTAFVPTVGLAIDRHSSVTGLNHGVLAPITLLGVPYGIEVDEDGSVYVGASEGHVYSVDLSSGATTLLGQLALDGELWGMAFRVPVAATLGSPACSSTYNSTGAAAIIEIEGDPSVAANSIALVAGPVPAQPGIFFYGPAEGRRTFGDGLRCVFGSGSTGVQRLPVTVPTAGRLAAPLDLTAPPTSSGSILPGTTWFFQAWFRDPLGGAAGFNLSDARALTLLP